MPALLRASSYPHIVSIYKSNDKKRSPRKNNHKEVEKEDSEDSPGLYEIQLCNASTKEKKSFFLPKGILLD